MCGWSGSADSSRRHPQLDCALHRIAVTQGRVHPPAKAYLERQQSEGKARREARERVSLGVVLAAELR